MPNRERDPVLQVVSDALPLVIAYLDRNLFYRFTNRYHAEQYGPRDAIGKHLREVIGDDAFREVAPHLERALAGETVTFEIEVTRAASESIWVRATYVPHKSPTGEVLGIAAFSEEITARRRDEIQLGDSERYLRLMADTIPQMVWVTNASGAVEYQNARWHEYTGIPEGEHSIDAWRSTVHPSDLPNVLAAQDIALATGADMQIEYRIRRRDGEYRWHLARTVFVSDSAGTLAKRFGTATDIHDQKVRAHQQQLFARTAAELASTMKMEARCEIAARRGVELFGGFCIVYLMSELDALPVAVAHEDPARTHEVRELVRALKSNRGARAVIRSGVSELRSPVDEIEMRGRLPRAQVDRLLALGLRAYVSVPLRTTGAPFGAISFAVGARGLDESDVPVAEGFASAVAWAIDNARLFEQQQRSLAHLEQAVRVRDEFLATLSHELRTPLTAILGYTSMLRNKVLPPERVENAITVIDRNARAQTKLIEDLLDASRIVSGKMRLDPRPTDLRRVLEDAVEGLRPAAAARAISLDVSNVRDVPPTLADPDRWQQIAWNLLANAIKFSRHGGHVALSLEDVGSRIVVTVHDDGIGIAPAFLPHVFDRFRQAESAESGSRAGLGLGLALVKQLVELHGGEVSVSSPGEGKGATFVVEVPRVAVDSRDAEPRHA